MTKREDLTLQTLSENDRWVVLVDRKQLEISGEQMRAIKEASEGGYRGMLHFKKISISIPHVSAIWWAGRDVPKNRQLSSRASPGKLTKEEFEKRKKALEKLRKEHGFLK